MARRPLTHSETRIVSSFWSDFFFTASLQGHIAFTLFSIHAVNPDVLTDLVGFNPGGILFRNMIYGNAMYIYSRPAMNRLQTSYRFIYSICGSLMFNYTSLMIYIWLYYNYGKRKLLASILGFFTGRFLYSTLYSYLYFVDVSANTDRRRYSILDNMFDEQSNYG